MCSEKAGQAARTAYASYATGATRMTGLPRAVAVIARGPGPGGEAAP